MDYPITLSELLKAECKFSWIFEKEASANMTIFTGTTLKARFYDSNQLQSRKRNRKRKEKERKRVEEKKGFLYSYF